MLVANWPQVLFKSATVWVAAIGLALPELLQFLADHNDALPFSPEWKNYIRAAVLLLIPMVRIIQQQSITTATERKLQEERLTRRQLEAVATSEGPPISADQVKAIKKEAAAAVKE